MFLEVTQVIGHHGDIRPPFLFQSDQDTHTDLMYAGLSDPVETIDTPFEFGFHAPRMINVVMCLVISFLEADYSIHSMLDQFRIFFRFQRHDFNLQIGKIRFSQIECPGNVRNPRLGRILSGNKQQVLKRSQFLDGLLFVFDFLFCQNGTLHGIADVETAIDT